MTLSVVDREKGRFLLTGSMSEVSKELVESNYNMIWILNRLHFFNHYVTYPRPFKTQKTSTYFKCQIICVQSYQMVPYPSCYILVPHQKILAFQNLIQVHSKPQTTLAGELYSCQITHVQYIKWYLILGVTCNSEDISMWTLTWVQSY